MHGPRPSIAQSLHPGGGAEDDAAKLLFRREPALRARGVSEFFARAALGRPADFARGIDGILTVDSTNDFRDGDIEFGQLIRLHPNPHGILPGAENRHLGNARHPAQRVAQVDVGVIRQKFTLVVRAIGGVESERIMNGAESDFWTVTP